MPSDPHEDSRQGQIASSWLSDEASPGQPSEAPEQGSVGRRPRPASGKGPTPVPWGAGEALLALLGVLVVGGVLTPVLVLPFDPDLDSTGGLLAAQALFGFAMVAASVMVASRWRTDGMAGALGRLGVREFKARQLAIGIGVLLGYYVVVAIFAALVVQPEQDDIGAELGIGGGDVLIATLAVLAIVVLAPVAEELFFRGVLFAGLRSRLAVWPAAIVSGVLFGGLHAVSGPTAAIPLALLGALLAWLYARSNSIWPCIAVHAANNALAVAVAG